MQRLSHLPGSEAVRQRCNYVILAPTGTSVAVLGVCVCLQMVIKDKKNINPNHSLTIASVLFPVAAKPGHTQTGGSGLHCQACTVWGITPSPLISSHLLLLLPPGERGNMHLIISCIQSARICILSFIFSSSASLELVLFIFIRSANKVNCAFPSRMVGTSSWSLRGRGAV